MKRRAFLAMFSGLLVPLGLRRDEDRTGALVKAVWRPGDHPNTVQRYYLLADGTLIEHQTIALLAAGLSVAEVARITGNSRQAIVQDALNYLGARLSGTILRIPAAI